MLEPDSRLSINQKIGGELYDLIDMRNITLSNGRPKELLSCVREETHMNDRLLRRLFLGNNDSLNHYMRILVAFKEWTSLGDFEILWQRMGRLVVDFIDTYGESFLEEQIAFHKPKHKS